MPLVAPAGRAQTLDLSYGVKGVQRLAYNGVVLADTAAHPGDVFHIWHMKSTDLAGNTVPGWGENKTGETWDAASHTETYSYPWGSISTHFVQTGNNLDIVVTERNNAGSGIVFDGAEIYPLTLHFPQEPVGFSGYTQYAITTNQPGVSAADFGAGIVTAVVPDESVPMYAGWKNVGAFSYSPLMTTSAPDGLATFLPRLDRPVPPGGSLTYTVSLRFTPAGVAASAADAYASFAATYPSQMTWSDRRILGTAFLASSPAGAADSTLAGGFPANPRRYFNDPAVDVTSAAGLQAFQNRMLALAAANVANARALNGQGVITWDIEGEQYPQATSYVCSPDQIATVAPEMETTVTNSASAYYGQKLDDAYFRTMTSAGLKVGLCLRPQVFTASGNGHASQVSLGSNAAIIANLEAKARYANGRWGATIFYVDSTVDAAGGTLDPAIFQQLITDFPGFLFIPEESTPRYYAYTAPLYSFIFHGDVGTPAEIYKIYPNAFGANLVNDVDAGRLAAATPQLTQAVRGGDILMGHADYWQANNPTLVSIYQAAGRATAAPVRVTPAVSWSAPAAITYGTPLSATQLNASSSAAGTFVYSPAAGAVLNAGGSTLTATFTPADTTAYSAATASATLTVTPAAPVLSWNTPAPVAAGTALGAAQLNATANVPGSFTYSPAAGTVPASGLTPLRVTFNPADGLNFTAATAQVQLTVTAGAPVAPVITWNQPAAIPYGTSLSSTQLNASASVAGAFSFLPSAGSVLRAGANTLVAMFTPADATRYTSATASVTQTVTRATPQLSWATPAAISSGSALGGAQLNAAASIPGAFTYSPAVGSVPAAGQQTLTAAFTPSDTADFSPASISVVLAVNPPAAQPVALTPAARLAILSPSDATAVSGTISVSARCLLQLDPAGSHLLVDGAAVPGHLTEGPFLFPLDTRSYSNGSHVLQVWAHDIGNNTVISAPVTLLISN